MSNESQSNVRLWKHWMNPLDTIVPVKKHFRSFACLFFLFSACIVCPLAGQAQQIDLSQFKREHLITNAFGGETGDVSIYVSFPNWFGRPGYCPVRVRVVPRKGLTFKRDGSLRLIMGSSIYSEGTDAKTCIDIPIENGTSEAKGEMLGNFLLEGNGLSGFRRNQFGITATLNGRKLTGQRVYVYNGRAGGRECQNLILISTESSKDDSRRLEALAEMAETGNWYSQETIADGVQQVSAFGDIRKLPSNWLLLSNLEHVSIGFDDLARLDATGLECLNQYVLAGGYLAINKVSSASAVANSLPLDLSRQLVESTKGSQKSQTSSKTKTKYILPSDFDPPRLDLLKNTLWDRFQLAIGKSALDGSNSPANVWLDARVIPYDLQQGIDPVLKDLLEVGKSYVDWKLASPSIFISRIYDDLIDSTPQTQVSGTLSDGSLSQSPVELKKPILLPHGFGTMYLDNRRRSDNSSAWEDRTKAITSQVLYDSTNRISRLSQGIGDDFWDWLIPSVGRTPAIPFLIFVVLFVGGAVPGIMYWSHQHKRRVWLVVLMPLTAAICTFFLFSYGLLKDGLGAVSRTRSLSFVDEKGDGMVWSRQSYFAATVSNQGMNIASETQFVPMTVNSYASLPDCEQFEVDGMQLYRGILAPRSQTQFSLTHPLRKLLILKRGSDHDPILGGPSILNQSNFTWNKAVFVDSKGEYFIASDVGPGQRAECIVSSRDETSLALQKEYKTQPLAPPADSPSADQTSLGQFSLEFFSFRSAFRPARTNNAHQITEEVTWTSLLSNKSGVSTVLSPGTYVIFASEAPYLERCLPGVKDQDGLHTIVGRW